MDPCRSCPGRADISASMPKKNQTACAMRRPRCLHMPGEIQRRTFRGVRTATAEWLDRIGGCRKVSVRRVFRPPSDPHVSSAFAAHAPGYFIYKKFGFCASRALALTISSAFRSWKRGVNMSTDTRIMDVDRMAEALAVSGYAIPTHAFTGQTIPMQTVSREAVATCHHYVALLQRRQQLHR